ncbi:MAG: MBL fold metallo-hydrolase [Bernardetiaceae bacterium]|jgi:glyoxylase-like metal-dependent hydrolase (beta-lactamase superfamily II)|nr:MBL fold metallo-hydrolase [Bernardetiaceae bacterium]
MLQVKSFTFNALEENTYVLYEPGGPAAIVDPGCYDRAEQATLQAFITEQGLRVTHLLNTHCHVDHVLGNQWVKDTYGVPLLAHALERQNLTMNPLFAPMFGFARYQNSEIDQEITPGQAITVGQWALQTWFVPGHSPGHVAFYHPEGPWVISGDVLFRGSIGRTDLPGGDYATLERSVREVLFNLPAPTTVYCGHGPATTIGHEQRTNPFFGATARA